ncbi:MAG: fibronectin type III domain-containing protein [Bdellovibrionales bacterium]|nr:fibronectin type III domain-containing protein [Bdellovibrionales bacterium]
MLTLTSCWHGGNGDDCEKPFDKLVEPDEIKNSSQIYIGINKLDFLDGGNFVIDDVTLESGLNGAHTQNEDITLDMNGIKLSRRDGAPYCDRMDRDGAHSRSYHKLHKMYLNGGMSFELFLLKLKLQRGTLRLSVNGKKIVLRDALVRFKGRHWGKCPNPDPGNPAPKPAPVSEITAVSPNETLTASSNISFTFSANQTGVTFWCALDSATPAMCTSPKAYTGVANGTHTFKVYAVNSSNKQEDPPKSYTWTVDSVAPTVTITNAAQLPTLTKQTAMSFQFAANEASSFQCSVDGSAFAPCTSPQSYSALQEGAHSFAVRAVDSVGNVSGTPAMFNWNIDLTNPVTTILAVEPAAAISNSRTRSFEFAASETSTFECSIDNGPFAACQSPLALADLVEGAHYFEVRATDLAGNLGVSVGVAWKNDYTAPVLSFGTVTPPVGLTNAKNLSAEFVSDEPASLYCSVDGAVAAECASPFVMSDMADGNHQLTVYAVDVAGNQSATGSLNWTVDSMAPTLSFAAIMPSASTYLGSGSIGFELAVSENADLTMSLNGAPVVTSNPIQFDGLSDGAYIFEVSAKDSAGNVSATIRHEWVFDRSAPSLTVTSDDTAEITRSDMRTFEFASDEAVTYECNADSAGFAACQTPLALSGLADGVHTLEVKAIDLAGNYTLASKTWSVDTRAPVTTVVASQTGSSILFSFTADEEATFECSLDFVTPVSCTDPVTYANLASGHHNFTVWATDVAGNKDPAGASYAFDVLNPIVTTITGRIPSSDVSNQSSATFEFSANQATSLFLCSLDGAPATVCNSPVSYSGLSDGPHTFNVKGVDVAGNMDAVGASSSWSVDTTAPVPNNISPTATTNSITVNWTTSEPATEQLRYGVGVAVTSQTPETATYTTSHSIRITGLSPNTMYTIQVFGRDQAGNTYLSATRTVRTSR